MKRTSAGAESEKETVEEPEKSSQQPSRETESDAERTKAEPANPPPQGMTQPPSQKAAAASDENVHASPLVRKMAREFGVDLTQVRGSAHANRITEADVKAFVKRSLARTSGDGGAASALPEVDEADFKPFGEIKTRPLNGIEKTAAHALQQSWQSIPMVTHFDQADITELDAYRKQCNEHHNNDAVPKLSILPFVVAAVTRSLQEFPELNSSIQPKKAQLIIKQYQHIGVAVDTEQGLMVPVLKNADTKGVRELATELEELSNKARERKLSKEEMQGTSFTVSSLGSIGGTGFTPLINHPQVAILGVARADIQPVWDRESETFQPRLILPLCLSYDHRAINGAKAARFTRDLAERLTNPISLLL
jgi:pyruvate dehydrogenase E2 component (dihydrolipoamide acetyltransferase)